jgi:hypothetical protein
MQARDMNLRRYLLVIAIAFSCLAITPSCNDDNGCKPGSGGIVIRELTLQPFNNVIAPASFQVRIEQGSEQSVEAEGHENIINDISTKVTDGVWVVSLIGDCYKDFDLTVRITLPVLEAVENSGSGDVILNSFDSLDQLTLLVSGSGQMFQSGVLNVSDLLTLQNSGSGAMTANFNTQRTDALLSGSGDIKLSGTTTSQSVVLSGSGSYSTFGLMSNICVMNSSGSGNAEISVSDELDANLSASGNISYKGMPTITSNVTGSGRLIDAN